MTPLVIAVDEQVAQAFRRGRLRRAPWPWSPAAGAGAAHSRADARPLRSGRTRAEIETIGRRRYAQPPRDLRTPRARQLRMSVFCSAESPPEQRSGGCVITPACASADGVPRAARSPGRPATHLSSRAVARSSAGRCNARSTPRSKRWLDSVCSRDAGVRPDRRGRKWRFPEKYSGRLTANRRRDTGDARASGHRRLPRARCAAMTRRACAVLILGHPHPIAPFSARSKRIRTTRA